MQTHLLAAPEPPIGSVAHTDPYTIPYTAETVTQWVRRSNGRWVSYPGNTTSFATIDALRMAVPIRHIEIPAGYTPPEPDPDPNAGEGPTLEPPAPDVEPGPAPEPEPPLMSIGDPPPAEQAAEQAKRARFWFQAGAGAAGIAAVGWLWYKAMQASETARRGTKRKPKRKK
jgi:hypothetical protein